MVDYINGKIRLSETRSSEQKEETWADGRGEQS